MSRYFLVKYGLGGSYQGGQVEEIIETDDDFTDAQAYEYVEEKAREEFEAYGLGEYEYNEYDEDSEYIDEEQYYEDEFESWAVYDVEVIFKSKDLESLKEEVKKYNHIPISSDEVEDYIVRI